jgi:hypothetical protein
MGSEQSIQTKHEITVRSQWGSTVLASSSQEEQHYDMKPLVENIDDIFVIDHVFSTAECEALIAAAECFGFGETNYPKDYRGNLRLITYDTSLATVVWERIQHLLPRDVQEFDLMYDVIGLNECWRLAKYNPGDRFEKHVDAYFEDHKTHRKSMFTLNIYMNDSFTGGETTFHLEAPATTAVQVRPQTGRCLIFRQPFQKRYLHEGERVLSGVKYLFRSDVMYKLRS